MATELETFKLLDRKLTARARELSGYDKYLEGEQPLKYMAPALEEEFGGRVTQLVINWPEIGTEAYESVLDVKGFRFPGLKDGDKLLWDMWRANDMDEQAPLLHTESIGLGMGYVISGPGEDDGDAPLMSVESPMQVYADRDPRTRKVRTGIKRWAEGEGRGSVQWGNLYTLEGRVTFRKDGRDWVEDDRDDHGYNSTLVVPFVNKPRMLYPDGRSEFKSIVPIADAINKMATDMMVSGEFHAMPRRYVFGMTEEDFQDESGRPLSTWKQLAGGIWSSETKGSEVQVGQFPEANLENFHSSIKLLFQVAAIQLALPSYISAFTGDNPASADAIRASESQKVKRAERKQVLLGGAHEEVLRNNLLILGHSDGQPKQIETLWRNPATPTKAQEADASVKLVTAKVIPPQQAREDLGYSPEQRDRMKDWDRENVLDPFFAQMNRETQDTEV